MKSTERGKVMEKNHATPILASYVTYKELSSHGNYKSPFEFYLPDAVLKSALRKIDFVTYDATGNYCVIGEKNKS